VVEWWWIGGVVAVVLGWWRSWWWCWGGVEVVVEVSAEVSAVVCRWRFNVWDCRLLFMLELYMCMPAIVPLRYICLPAIVSFVSCRFWRPHPAGEVLPKF